ncbi:hypothetical protein ACTFIW_000283 [Dictyostelium discoideum]
MNTLQSDIGNISEISKRVSKSDTKNQIPKCKAERHHKILFVGEGNFSFSTSLLKKHNQKYHTNDNQFLKITASDLYVCETVFNEFKDCRDVLKETGVKTYKCITVFCGITNDKKCENCLLTIENIKFLINSQCKVIFGLDARKIHESNEKYSKIYWSMPHDNSRYKTGTLPHLISDFCLSCSEAQKLGDKVHFIIAQVYKDDYSAIHTQFQQGIVYNIIEGPFIAGYTLEKRIHFKNNRYEGYKHQNTQGTMTIDSSVGRMEFVFKKSGIILENYKNVASKFRRFCVIDLEGDEEDRINEYKIMIQSSYKNLLYFDIEGIRRYYIGDNDYQPQFNSDNYYDDDHDDQDDYDSEYESSFNSFKSLSTSDNSRQL